MMQSKKKNIIKKYLNYLHPGKETIECCAIRPKVNKSGSGSGIVCGWGHDHKKMAKIAYKADQTKPEGTFVSLNPCDKSLEDRTNGKLKANINRTTDSDILKLSNLLIDVDPRRPSGISSTDEEHKAAFKTAKRIRRFLKKKGWPTPLVLDSGNGAQLIYKTNLENNKNNKDLMRDILLTLAQEFNSDKINIDTSVYNPSRIVRVPGTFNRKGKDSSERPHRRAKILAMPKKIKWVSIKRLKKLASMRQEIKEINESEKAIHKPKLMDVPAYLEHYEIETKKPKPWRDGTLYRLKKCLFNDDHTPNKASIFQSSEGILYYQCFHDSCRGKKWEDARKEISGSDKLTQFYEDLPQQSSVDDLKYSIWTGSELVDEPVKERPLIKGLLEKSGSLLIVGQTGIMKSMLTLNMAMNMAALPKDRRLWGVFDINKTVRTLFIQSENSLFGTKNRLKLMVKGNKKYEKALDKIYFPNIQRDCRISGDLRNEDFQNVLKELIFKTKARLIVIDPFISFHNQDENANADIRKVLDELTNLCHVTNVACVLVHHMGKASSSNVFAGRGASALADWANNILILTNDDNTPKDSEAKWISVNYAKSRNFRTCPPFTLEASGKLQFTKVDEPKGKQDYQVAVDLLASHDGKIGSQKEFKEALRKAGVKSDSSAGRLINKAVKAGRIEPFHRKNSKEIGYRLTVPTGE